MPDARKTETALRDENQNVSKIENVDLQRSTRRKV